MKDRRVKRVALDPRALRGLLQGRPRRKSRRREYFTKAIRETLDPLVFQAGMVSKVLRVCPGLDCQAKKESRGRLENAGSLEKMETPAFRVWKVSKGHLDFLETLASMDRRVQKETPVCKGPLARLLANHPHMGLGPKVTQDSLAHRETKENLVLQDHLG